MTKRNTTRQVLATSIFLAVAVASAAAEAELPIRNDKGQIQWTETLSAIFPKDVSEEPCEYTPLVAERPPLRGVQLPARDCTEDDFRTLREWGATLVRYQMTEWRGSPRSLGDPDAGYEVYDRWLAGKLDHLERDVLPWARKYGMMVVVDLHKAPGDTRDRNGESPQYRDPRVRGKFIATWRMIALRFRGNEDVIYGYDLVNEPQQVTKVEYGYWEMQFEAAKAIREIDPATPIVMEGNVKADPCAYPFMKTLPMKDVVYQIHMYMPGDFTCQGIGGVDKEGKRPPWPNPAHGWDKAYLRRLLRPVRDFQLRHDARIYVGEFSATTWAEGAEIYLRELIELMEEYGWDWTYHAFREHPCWDVEKEAPTKFSPWSDFTPSSDNPRKRALIEGILGGADDGR
ncbi:MAG: cellulase family glycosylhydrolase [Kiritimatiellae bacterium]|nr:cellulase family glycosylhydrolase [Kiritimatiellia bacterium]